MHNAGLIERYGAVLKDVGTGRVVGHLHETWALHAALRAAGGLPNPITDLVNSGSSLAANHQLYRLDTKVEALRLLMGGLQAMQAATLALAAVGIGLSALGFAAMKTRLDTVSHKVDELMSVVQVGFQEHQISRLRDVEAKLSGEAR